MCFMACPEKCTEEWCPSCLLVLWTSKLTQTHSCLTDKITCLGWVDTVFFTPCFIFNAFELHGRKLMHKHYFPLTQLLIQDRLVVMDLIAPKSKPFYYYFLCVQFMIHKNNFKTTYSWECNLKYCNKLRTMMVHLFLWTHIPPKTSLNMTMILI